MDFYHVEVICKDTVGGVIMSCSSCKKSCNKNATQCPLCDQTTQRIVADEVYEMIKESVKPHVHGRNFHLCENENCEVVFHSRDGEQIILTQDINKQFLTEANKATISERL